MAGHFYFLTLESTELYPQNEEVATRCCHRILQRGCIAVGTLGDLVLRLLPGPANGGKPKGATKEKSVQTVVCTIICVHVCTHEDKRIVLGDYITYVEAN